MVCIWRLVASQLEASIFGVHKIFSQQLWVPKLIGNTTQPPFRDAFHLTPSCSARRSLLEAPLVLSAVGIYNFHFDCPALHCHRHMSRRAGPLASYIFMEQHLQHQACLFRALQI